MISLKWALTYRCDLNCKTCIVGDQRKFPVREMSLDKSIMAMKEMRRNYVSKLVFYGGEPLVSEKLIPLLKMGKNMGFKMALNTNAQKITSKLAEQLWNNGLGTIIVSLDGPTAEINDYIRGAGAFHRTINALKCLINQKRDKRCMILVNMVYHKKFQNSSLGILFDAFKKLKEELIGVDSIGVSYPDFQGNLKDNVDVASWEDIVPYINLARETIVRKLKILFEMPPRLRAYFSITYGFSNFVKKKNYCMGATTALYLEPNGLLLPCGDPFVMEYLKNKYPFLLDYQDLNKVTFKQAYTSPLFKRFFQEMIANKKRIDNSIKSDKICGDCIFYEQSICNIGCPFYPPSMGRKYPKMCGLIREEEKRNGINKAIYENFINNQ